MPRASYCNPGLDAWPATTVCPLHTLKAYLQCTKTLRESEQQFLAMGTTQESVWHLSSLLPWRKLSTAFMLRKLWWTKAVHVQMPYLWFSIKCASFWMIPIAWLVGCSLWVLARHYFNSLTNLKASYQTYNILSIAVQNAKVVYNNVNCDWKHVNTLSACKESRVQ